MCGGRYIARSIGVRRDCHRVSTNELCQGRAGDRQQCGTVSIVDNKSAAALTSQPLSFTWPRWKHFPARPDPSSHPRPESRGCATGLGTKSCGRSRGVVPVVLVCLARSALVIAASLQRKGSVHEMACGRWALQTDRLHPSCTKVILQPPQHHLLEKGGKRKQFALNGRVNE
jgi:hypothetical protein